MAREARRGRDHVLLGDPALEEPLGIGELERAHAAVRREVGVEDDEVLVARRELDELLAVGVDDVLVGDARLPRSRAALRLALRGLARSSERGQLDVRGRIEPERREALLDPRRELRRARCSNGSSPGAPACQR